MRVRHSLMIRMFIMLSLALAVFTGCVAGESEQKKAGKAIMNQYFKDTGRNAYVSSIYADVTRPASDRLMMTDFVKGEYILDGETYNFWANVKNGNIYTDERKNEYFDSVLRHEAAKLGLDTANCTCFAYITMYEEFTGDSRKDDEFDTTSSIFDVLPVTITDMDDFVTEALESEYVFVDSIIVCREMPDISAENKPELSDWSNLEISVVSWDDPDSALPTDKYDILRYWLDNKDRGVELRYVPKDEETVPDSEQSEQSDDESDFEQSEQTEQTEP